MPMINNYGRHNPCCPPANYDPCSPKCGFYPPAPCPLRPNPGTIPTITCTPGYQLYLEQIINQSGSAVLQDIFTASDGPAPYTITSVEIVGTQQAVYNVQIVPVGVDKYQVTAEIQPFVLIDYTDGLGVQRGKFEQMTVPVQAMLATGDPVGGITFVSYLNSTTATNPVLTGNTLTFSYNINTTLLGANLNQISFAVVDTSGCPVPSNLPVMPMRILPIESVCETEFPLLDALIPFTPVGTPPYTVTNVTSLPGGVNVISQDTDILGNRRVEVAFPVEVTFVSADAITTTQASYLYTIFTISSLSIIPDTQLLLNLSAVVFSRPTTFSSNFPITSGIVSGTISQVQENAVSVTVTPVVNCGAVSCPCDVITIPPTEPTIPPTTP